MRRYAERTDQSGVLADNSEKKMTCLNERRPTLRSFVAGKEDGPARLFRIAFEHRLILARLPLADECLDRDGTRILAEWDHRLRAEGNHGFLWRCTREQRASFAIDQ